MTTTKKNRSLNQLKLFVMIVTTNVQSDCSFHYYHIQKKKNFSKSFSYHIIYIYKYYIYIPNQFPLKLNFKSTHTLKHNEAYGAETS